MRTFLLSILLFCTAVSFGDFHPSQADFNGDGIVNIEDLALFASAWLWESPCLGAEQVLVDTHYITSTDDNDWYIFTPELTTYYLVSLCDGNTADYAAS
ncbi:MAG TPA: hypothetical protein PKZ89_02935, partial [Alphaproteobacteria bacterium]|nr:hypothetical protein [Alphaproteobacteria bacterium]